MCEGELHPYGEMINKYEFRKRDMRKEINPDMKFSMNMQPKKNQSVGQMQVKNKKTFINALQFFYNKINIGDTHKENEVASKTRKDKNINKMNKKALKEAVEDEATSDPDKKKEEAMNFIGEVAKNVLTKYDFFPNNKIPYLREGEGKTCSNPFMKNREVYMTILGNIKK